MALARVQATGKVIADAAASVALTFATPPTLGNGLVVLVTGYNNPSPGVTTCADNRGNAYTLAIAQLTPPTPVEVAIYACAAVTTTAAPFTVTVTGTAGTYWVASAVEVSGVGTGLTVDGTAGRAASLVTPVGTGATAALTTGADTFLAAVLSLGGAEATITVESVVPAWTQEHEDLSFAHAVGEADTRVVTAAGGTTPSCTWTISTPQPYSAALAAFKAGGGAAGAGASAQPYVWGPL
jgi:hypothetical protein